MSQKQETEIFRIPPITPPGNREVEVTRGQKTAKEVGVEEEDGASQSCDHTP